MDAKNSGAAAYSTESGRHSGTTLTDARREWPTPLVGSGENSHGQISGNFRAQMDARLRELWPTPTSAATTGAGSEGRDGGDNNQTAAALWNTPRCGTHGQPGARDTMTGDALEPQAQKWATPRANERVQSNSGDVHEALSKQVGSWATPTSRDWKIDDPAQSPEHSPPLGRQVLRTETAGSDGLRPVVLNPSFVEALMNFPPSWTVPIEYEHSGTPLCQTKPELHSAH